ncbi:MAG: helix-turn-helix domain-containing protein [Syntrophaceae bacterium]|nr:helix-turn-helix domain-containing protein [Syntrophaceae bacterium]
MSFFKRLSKFRRPSESDREFAARIGCKHQQISMWRSADSGGDSQGAMPSPKTLNRIAVALGVEAEWLIWG